MPTVKLTLSLCTLCLDVRLLHSPVALAELVASVQVFATFAPETVACVEVAVRLHVVEAPHLHVRRLVLLRRLPGVCPRKRAARRDHLLDTVYLFALVLLPVNVHAGGTDGGSGAGSGNVCLAALEEEGTGWVVAGLGECSAGARGVGWRRHGGRFACLSLTVSRCCKSERSIEGREGEYLT
jgi:hypothetical protein